MDKNILNLEEEEVVKLFLSTMKQYVNEVYEKITSKCKIPNKGITARYNTISEGDFYMDYSCIYPTYSKEDAKLALEIFNHYSNVLTLYLDILKFVHTKIEYSIGKSPVSSSRIGKCLHVYNFPFALPNEYCEGGENT